MISSQFFEQFLKMGKVCADPAKTPRKVGDYQVQNTDQSSLNVPDDIPVTMFLTEGPGVTGNQGEKFKDGESGPGVKPYGPLQGSMIASIKVGTDKQTAIALGTLYSTGGKGGGGGGSDESDHTPPGTNDQEGNYKPIKETTVEETTSIKDGVA